MDSILELTISDLEIIDRALQEVSAISRGKGLEADVQAEAERYFSLDDQVRDIRKKIELIKEYKENEST